MTHDEAPSERSPKVPLKSLVLMGLIRVFAVALFVVAAVRPGRSAGGLGRLGAAIVVAA